MKLVLKATAYFVFIHYYYYYYYFLAWLYLKAYNIRRMLDYFGQNPVPPRPPIQRFRRAADKVVVVNTQRCH